MRPLRTQPLTAASMAPFGSVIESVPEGAPVNGGTSLRHEAVAELNLQHDGGRAALAVYEARARALPFEALVLERHRWSDQVFLPLGGARRCVLLLAPATLERPRAEDCVALLANGRQGFRIAAGTWHHGLLALNDGPWAVLERRAEAVDCDEVALDEVVLLDL